MLRFSILIFVITGTYYVHTYVATLSNYHTVATVRTVATCSVAYIRTYALATYVRIAKNYSND